MFTIEKKLTGRLGRAGTLLTPHGVIHTPAFVAVGTKATVKALTPEQLKETGAEIVLGNTYHLYLEPGEKVVERAGGLGKFMGWEGPTMTDSGGFQVFSLGAAFGKHSRSKITTQEKHPHKLENVGVFRREEVKGSFGKITPHFIPQHPMLGNSGCVVIDEDGVLFKSPKDGSEHRFTPERSIEIQHTLGADIIFAFDECTSPDAPYAYQREAMERTHRWAERSLTRHAGLRSHGCADVLKNNSTTGVSAQMLFGIVQGGRFEDLRKESARVIGSMELALRPARLRNVGGSLGEGRGFDGFGIGGSFEKEDMGNAVRWVNEILPEEKPRHLLGIGNPLDMFEAVENGCDLFDCVTPTREARTGALYTNHGRFNIENAKYRNDFSPIEEGCGCYTCRPRHNGGAGFTRAYIAHLFRSNEILANTLATIHNLHFMAHLVRGMREAILGSTFEKYKADFLSLYSHR